MLTLSQHDGQLEIHVPLHYTEQNTAICFTHDTQNADINVTDHPLGSQLPHPTNGPSTHALGPGALFRQFMVPPDYPPTFDAFIAQDRPLINLHVTTFRDATTVGVAWPHITMDAAAYGQMLRAWSLVLAGRESEVPPVFDLRRDALQEMEEAAAKEFKPEPLVHGQPELTGWRFIYLLAISYWGILFGPAMQKRAIFIPRATCDRFVRSVKAGVASIPVTATPGGGGDSTSNWFVGENDILIAWIARIIQLSQSASRPVTVAAIASVSHRLAPVLEMAGAGHVFLQNMLTMTRYHLPAAGAAVRSNQDQEQDYVQQGLPANALRIKLQNAEQTHPGNITSNTAQVRKRGRSKLQLYGAKNAIVLLVNPLSKLDLITAADFAPAVVRQGEASETRTNPLGTALFKYNTGVTKVNDGLNIFFTLGQTHRGDRWLQGNFTERTWRLLESELAKMEGRQT